MKIVSNTEQIMLVFPLLGGGVQRVPVMDCSLYRQPRDLALYWFETMCSFMVELATGDKENFNNYQQPFVSRLYVVDGEVAPHPVIDLQGQFRPGVLRLRDGRLIQPIGRYELVKSAHMSQKPIPTDGNRAPNESTKDRFLWVNRKLSFPPLADTFNGPNSER
jgi:hypothetical protein